MRRIRNRGRSKRASENRHRAGGKNPRTEPVYVMTFERITAGINKTDRRHDERADQVRRCVTAGISNGAGQLSPIS